MRRGTMCAAMAWLAGCAIWSAERSPEEEALERLCADYWDHLMESSPTWATYLGDRRFDAELEEIDAEARRRRKAGLEGFLGRLEKVERSRLGERARVTVDVLEHSLHRALEEIQYRFYQWDVDQMSGPQVWLFELVNHHPMDAEGRGTFLQRLGKFPRYMRDYLGNLREGLEEGNVAPRVAVDRVLVQLRRIVEEAPDRSPLMKAAEKAGSDAGAFREVLRRSVEDHVLPAFREMLRFLEEEYVSRAREAAGIGTSEFGRRAYENRILRHTTLPYRAEELHQIGLEVMADLERRMEQIARGLGHQGDLREFHEKLRSDSERVYAQRDEVEEAARECLQRAREFLPRMFGKLPQAECVVKRLEEYREADAPAAYYYGPPDDGSRPGIYYVNTFQPEQRPRYNMPALSLHEAVPGHHLQIAVARELTDLPDFRRHTGVTAFVEGWALYAELLGEEVGFYRDDLERFGMLTFQAWRAARLVVDTGMHSLGWTREEAVQYLREHVAISEKDIQNEIDRYIIWPGQALAYMVGRLKIQELRRKAEEELGEHFDVRSFHDALLENGALPLPVLEAVMDRWIERQR